MTLKLIEGNRHMAKASAMNSKKKAAKKQNKSAGWRIPDTTIDRFNRWLSLKKLEPPEALEKLMRQNPVTDEEIRRYSEDLREKTEEEIRRYSEDLREK